MHVRQRKLCGLPLLHVLGMTHHMLPMVWNGHIIEIRGVILQVQQGRQATVGPQAL